MLFRPMTVTALVALMGCFAAHAQAQGVAKGSFVDVQGRSVGSTEFWQDAPNAVIVRLAVTVAHDTPPTGAGGDASR